MLNISDNSISSKIDRTACSTLNYVEAKQTRKLLLRIMKIAVASIIVIGFLPWTQNVRSIGEVTTLSPEQRPQTIHSVIPGRVEAWFVKEGDFVKKGDTIAKLSEIKEDYFDAQLLNRTEDQLNLKKEMVDVYGDKVMAQESQMNAIKNQQMLTLQQVQIKLQQAKLKMQYDSIAYETAKVNEQIASTRFQRMDSLYQAGLKSKLDYESRNLSFQKAQAEKLETKNKYLNSQNELNAITTELQNTRVKFDNEYAKAMSERLSAKNSELDAAMDVQKLANQYKNYEVRSSFYYITAPQDGYITKGYINGIGEIIKDGQAIVSIMPAIYDFAVELYVDPIDLPLMQKGKEVMIQFDGWPAIVFSGWPNTSYGTFSGEIYAIDQFISENGKYRILVKPAGEHDHWPVALRVGGGAKAIILLEDVAIGYEIWRKVNGFPPNFYKEETTKKLENK